MKKYPDKFIERLGLIKSGRAKIVVDHILKYGFITTRDLQEKYGYDHPPRAIRDVREFGIPIETYKITDKDGKSIGAYKFGDPEKLSDMVSKKSGRTALSKAIKKALIEKYGSKCFIYMENIDEGILQVDHRIPYEISGEIGCADIDDFMLLSPSANRAKSWTCEHCQNWDKKDISFCMKCFWSHPENYDHVAGKKIKVVNLYFTGNEVEDYNKLIELSGEADAQQFIKNILHDYINKNT